MKKIIGITAGGLLAYFALTFLVGQLAPAGTPRWILLACLWLLGIIAAAVVVWFMSRRSKESGGKAAKEGDSPAQAGEIDLLVRDAEAKLAAARAGNVGSLPAILMIGEPGSTKTSIVLHSGLEPELLAGQMLEENNVQPTPATNLWLAGRILIAEFGGKLLTDDAAWKRLVGRLQPSKLGSVFGSGPQAPRAALICIDIESLGSGGGSDAALAAGRNLRQKLGEISGMLGIRLPVYALFTKLDRVPFFLEFVRNLSPEDTRQVVGASLPLAGDGGAGFAEREKARLTSAYDDIVRSLCDARPDVLAREHDASQLPGAYEFPREMRKLRASIVTFLVELCRPSQLAIGPFLRGFYFSGIRPIVLDEQTGTARPQAPVVELPDEMGATRMMKVGAAAHHYAPPPMARITGSRKVPQWVFLTQLFEKVLLQDRIAMGASGSSTKTSTLRRVLLACAAALCLFACVGWTVSFVRNRGLESGVRDAAQATTAPAPAGPAVASLESLQALESLRQNLLILDNYKRYRAPMSYRWGLYEGNEIHPEVYRLYFARFKQVLFGQTQDGLLDQLRRVPVTSAPAAQGPEYGATYDTLKAYLITTSNHEKSTRDFLAPVLLKRWSENRNVPADRVALAQKQFEFYADQLLLANPYSSANDVVAIERTRRYLASFAGIDRVYQAMLVDAAKTSHALNFNKQFPGSAEVVVETKEVAGPYTKAGWDFMKNAVHNPDRYFSGERWVLGDQAGGNIDRTNLDQRLQAKYYSDFLNQWRGYLAGASVVKYKDLKDAAQKLNVISGNVSPLLSLLCLASQHVAVDDPVVANAFQPVTAVVPPACAEKYIASSNQNYMNSLVVLQTSLDAASQAENNDAAAAQSMSNATAARISARQLAQTFRIDPEGHTESKVLNLLIDPIANAEALIRSIGPAELNGKGKSFCGQMSAVWKKYPFNPKATAQATVAEVNGIFHKPDGALWTFYDTSLQKVLPLKDGQFVLNPAAGVTLNPAFVSFFKQAAALSGVLYAGNTPDPHFSFTVKPLPSEGIPTMGINVQLDGQTLAYSGGTAAAQPFKWQAAGPHAVRSTLRMGGPALDWITRDGLWSIFQFFDQAERSLPADSGQILEWTIRAGKDVVTVEGKPVTVRFQLNMGDTPPVFQKDFFARMACVPEVAKQ